MALTLPRWIATFVIGALLLVPVLFKEPAPSVSPLPTELALEMKVQRAEGEARTMAGRVRTLQIRDSLTSAPLETRSLGPGLSIAIDRALDPSLVPDLEALVARSREMSVPNTVMTPTVVAFVLDDVRLVRGVSRRITRDGLEVDYVLPAGPGAPCTVLARVPADPAEHFYEARAAQAAARFPARKDSVRAAAEARRLARARSWLQWDALHETLLGPCAFYAAFGMPGAHVQRWLNDGGWSLAQVNTWEQLSTQPQTERQRNRLRDLREFVIYQREDGESFELQAVRSVFSRFEGETVRSALSLVGIECLAALADGCTKGLLDPDPARRLAQVFAGNVVSPRGLYYSNGVSGGWELSFGNRQRQLFSDFIYTHGQERFGRMWRSNLSVAEALSVDGGINPSQATMEWAQANYGSQQLGPTMHTAAVASGGATIVIGLLLSFAAARRRQAT